MDHYIFVEIKRLGCWQTNFLHNLNRFFLNPGHIDITALLLFFSILHAGNGVFRKRGLKTFRVVAGLRVIKISKGLFQLWF
jgi:hypothetical protein